MSPGPTFDRVYLALKEQLMAGRFAPGDHLEPVQIGEELHSSITPVRDALHRLVGERLVEAPRNDGFRAPMVTELGLRRLYGWQVDLVRLVVLRLRPVLAHGGPLLRDEEDCETAASFFLSLGQAAGDAELLHALANAGERLAAAGLVEMAVIGDLADELETFRTALQAHQAGALRAAIAAYQRRRNRAVPRIVQVMQRTI